MMGSSSNSSDGIEWEDQMGSMSAQMTAAMAGWTITDKETGNTYDKINWSFKQGAYVKIRINNPNTSMHPMQHPFHVHGQRFLVLSENGKPNTNMVWKDTVLLPAGTTTDILVEMSNPGQWMMHCHIAEHLESGMMLNYEVK
jgi:FtsP/CotA-like multicopper oxidase with cupredoxin domain